MGGYWLPGHGDWVMITGVSKPPPSWPSAWSMDIRAWVKLQAPSGWSHVRCPFHGGGEANQPQVLFYPHLINESEVQRGEVT